jgi:hypothetical protein
MADELTEEDITEYHAKDQAAKAGRREANTQALKNMLVGAETGEEGETTGGILADDSSVRLSAPEFTPKYTSARARRQDLYGE